MKDFTKKIIGTILIFVMMLYVSFDGVKYSFVYAEELSEIREIESVDIISDGFESGSETQMDTSDLAEDVCTKYTNRDSNIQVINCICEKWEGGFNASFVVKNIGNLDIRNWYLRFPAEFEISNIWNANIVDIQDGYYLVKNVGWNSTIEAGGCVQFFVTVYEDFSGFPCGYEVLGTNIKKAETEYEVSYKINDVWEEGVTGSIEIKNCSASVIEDWEIEFDCINSFECIWDADIVEQGGAHYVIRNKGYNRDIQVGGSVSIGFVAKTKDRSLSLSNVSLSAFSLFFANEDEKELDKKVEVKKDDMGIKPAKESDIVFEEGSYYVKNQIILSAHLGTSKKIIDELVEELNADIVGQIELIADYQLEFREEKTYHELQELITYIKSFPFVRYVELNLAAPCENKYFSSDYNSWEWSEKYVGGDNWGLEALKVIKAWDYKEYYKGKVKVGVLDNVFGLNEDLEYAWRYVKGEIIKEGKNDHGTHVAGIIGATHDNGKGISGVATDVDLYCYSCDFPIQTWIEKITRMVEQGTRVINVSYGYVDEMVYSATMHPTGKTYMLIASEAEKMCDALKSLIYQGYDFLIVNSAGNGNGKKYVEDKHGEYEYAKYNVGDNSKVIIGYPDAKYNSCLSMISDTKVKSRIVVVGAAELLRDESYDIAEFSNRGNRVDIYAPGVNILSTVPQREYGYAYAKKNGTSMAAPYISGLAALMLQVNPDLTASRIKTIITRERGYEVGDGKYMPDAEKCVLAAINEIAK